ncbi:MAG: hypothetical protein U5K27_16395 [Desulfotignum sp.]|nr:hypothetical protein [Desulfotignum sp.]
MNPTVSLPGSRSSDLKNFVSEKTDHLFAVNELQKAINTAAAC